MLTPNGCIALSRLTNVNQLKFKHKYLLLMDVEKIGQNALSTMKRSLFFLIASQADLYNNLLILTNTQDYAINPLNPP